MSDDPRRAIRTECIDCAEEIVELRAPAAESLRLRCYRCLALTFSPGVKVLERAKPKTRRVLH